LRTHELIEKDYSHEHEIEPLNLSRKSNNKVIQVNVKVGLERFELSTFRLSAERSSQTELQAHKHTIKIFHLLKDFL
jgi:hypothetical protein